MGFVENDSAKYVYYVVVDECADEEMMAKSKTAQTLFAEIVERTLPILKVYPEGEINYHINVIPEDQIVTDPDNTDYDPEQNEGSVDVIPN